MPGDSLLTQAGLYFHTVRHLRPVQLAHLCTRPLRRRMPAPQSAPMARWPVAEERHALLRQVLCESPALKSGDRALQSADRVLTGEFRFLNETMHSGDVDWSARHVSPLWSFHLHYCEYIEDLARAFQLTRDARYTATLGRLLETWLEPPVPLHGDAWAPYVVARRLVHWTRAYLLCGAVLPTRLRRQWEAALAVQTVYLARNIEWHLLANHVQKNLHAVACVTALFGGLRATRLRKRALLFLWRQWREQVLPDGMHYERSPMYHGEALADFHDLVALARALGHNVPHDAAARLCAMRAALARFVRSDGSMHLFNDAANDDHERLVRLADGGGAAGCWALPDAGYFGCSAPSYRFIIDCGEPGPAYQPAHAHCDLLSFELDIHGHPLIVDSGTSGYDGDPLRSYVRSTRAHNTVQIGSIEQHEMWGTFRVARRARILHAHLDTGRARFTAAYTPYASERIVHERAVDIHEDLIRITDVVAGTDGVPVRSFLHFHPAAAVRLDGEMIRARHGSVEVRITTSNVAAARIACGEVAPAQGWYAPEFGVRLPAPVLEMLVADPAAPFGFTIEF